MRRHYMSHICVLAVALSGLLPASRGDDFTLPKTYRPIGLEWNEAGQFHWLTAKVNGVTVSLMLDTGGANTVYIDEQTAILAGVESFAKTKVVAFNGTSSDATFGLVDTVEFGDVVFRRQSLLVVTSNEFSEVIEKKTGVRLRGAVGASLLKQRGGIIDYRKHKLYLNNCDEIELQQMQGSWIATEAIYAGEKVINSAWLDASRLDISGDRMTLSSGGLVHSGRFCQFTDRPAHGFQFFTYAKNGVKRPPGAVGLYCISQDKLAIALPATKQVTYDTLPKKLESTAENGLCLWTFVRYPLPVAPPPREKPLDLPLPLPGTPQPNASIRSAEPLCFHQAIRSPVRSARSWSVISSEFSGLIP